MVIGEQQDVNKSDQDFHVMIDQLSVQIEALQKERLSLVTQLCNLTEEFHKMDT